MYKEEKKEPVSKLSNRFLKEAGHSSMTTTTTPKKILWRPNNYRRKIQVKTKTNSVKENIIHTIPIKQLTYTPHTKLIFIKKYHPNITIQYGKNTLTGIYSQNIIYGKKETYLIETKSFKHCQRQLDKKKKEIRKRIDKAVIAFAKQFKIYLPVCKLKWDRYEDWIKGEDYIDKIPKETIIHDTYFKKVYGEGIEFKSSEDQKEPIVYMKNYIKNRAVEDLSPQIADEINNMHQTLAKDLNPSIKALSEQIKLHLAVEQRKLEVETKALKNQKIMNDLIKEWRNEIRMNNQLGSIKSRISKFKDVVSMKDEIQQLSQQDKQELSKWIFARFKVALHNKYDLAQ